MDGLCASIAMVASCFFLWLALMENQSLVGFLAASLTGATLGFLRWNLNRAKIFMGDSGALFIGLMMSVLAITLQSTVANRRASWMIPFLILGVPILDTSLVVVSRLRRGLAPSRSPGKGHVAHRLANAGLGKSGAVIFMNLAGVVFGGVAISVTQLTASQSYLLFGMVIFLIGLAIVWLEQAPYEHQEPNHERPRTSAVSDQRTFGAG